jgi:hypothetical protein
MEKVILLVMLCICPLLQGCVGFVIVKQEKVVTENPSISLHPNDELPAYSRDRSREILAAHPYLATNLVSYPRPWLKPYWGTNAVYTSAWLKSHWGSPNHIRYVGFGSDADADEVWTYRLGPIWEGIMPWLIVPVPLVLPVGEKKVCFTLRHGQVVNVSLTRPALGGFFWPTGM